MNEAELFELERDLRVLADAVAWGRGERPCGRGKKILEGADQAVGEIERLLWMWKDRLRARQIKNETLQPVTRRWSCPASVAVEI